MYAAMTVTIITIIVAIRYDRDNNDNVQRQLQTHSLYTCIYKKINMIIYILYVHQYMSTYIYVYTHL
jgi:hypothetical protein